MAAWQSGSSSETTKGRRNWATMKLYKAQRTRKRWGPSLCLLRERHFMHEEAPRLCVAASRGCTDERETVTRDSSACLSRIYLAVAPVPLDASRTEEEATTAVTEFSSYLARCSSSFHTTLSTPGPKQVCPRVDRAAKQEQQDGGETPLARRFGRAERLESSGPDYPRQRDGGLAALGGCRRGPRSGRARYGRRCPRSGGDGSAPPAQVSFAATLPKKSCEQQNHARQWESCKGK